MRAANEMPFESDDKHDEGSAPDRAPDRHEYPKNGTAEVAFAQQRISLVSSRKSLRINSGRRSLKAIQPGFKQLSEEDQQMLRKWFSIPAAASVAQVCRILADRAPDMVCEDLIHVARKR